MHPSTFIELYKPCGLARKHLAKFEHMSDAWDKCERPDWMLWLLNKMEISCNKQKLAAKFVREIWHLLKDERSKAAIVAIENDCLTDEIIQAAYAAAYDAAAARADARAAAHAAYDAAAARADARAAAHAAAHAATDAATYAAIDAAYAAYVAAYAADAAMSKKQCDIIRAFIPNPFKS